MKGKEFAIVDIETTGGSPAGSGITEIAIWLFDGEQVTERFETLVNPHRPIPPAIRLMTGIDDAMVAGSPSFSDLAAEIFRLLSGRIFVAHNVNFDYTFLKYFLEREGYAYSATRLCTVRMSRKISPGLPSYSLGRLCASLNIPLHNHHRAGGDTAATALLFQYLLARDTEGHIGAMLRAGSHEQLLPPNLPAGIIERLPQSPGVYYFRDRTGKVIYVGKAANIRKRVLSHFTGHNPRPQRQHFLRLIADIDFECCGTELMALLLEAVEIKRLWPEFNRAIKRQEPRYGLYAYEDLNGYMRLVVGRQGAAQTALHTFNRETEGRNLLHKLVRRFDLCPGLCALGDCAGGHEAGECTAQLPALSYNSRVREALEYLGEVLPSFMILDKGRHDDEQSCIWVEKGVFTAMGYIGRDTDIRETSDLRASLTRYAGNDYMMQLIASHLEKYPWKATPVAPGSTGGADSYQYRGNKRAPGLLEQLNDLI